MCTSCSFLPQNTVLLGLLLPPPSLALKPLVLLLCGVLFPKNGEDHITYQLLFYGMFWLAGARQEPSLSPGRLWARATACLRAQRLLGAQGVQVASKSVSGGRIFCHFVTLGLFTCQERTKGDSLLFTEDSEIQFC